jgi:hypothetical protein
MLVFCAKVPRRGGAKARAAPVDRGETRLGSHTTKAMGAVCPHQQRPVGTDEGGSAGSETATGLARTECQMGPEAN